MRTVWKFPLQLGARGWQAVNAGPGPVVLVGLDPATGKPAVWIEHVPAFDGRNPVREFGIFPTGGNIAADAEHRGSLVEGPFVWHVYERIS